MIMITGGAYQGKRNFACKKLNINHIFNGSECDFLSLSEIVCIADYHLLIKKLTENGIDPVDFTQSFCSNNKEAVVIIDEIGSGIIPMDKKEREWRENVGRCGSIIADNSHTVIRMICGIPTVIKGKMP